MIGRVQFFSDSQDSDNVRATLLKHYSSQCTAHGAYLIAIAVGLLSFVSALPHFWPIPILTRVILLGLISSILFSLTIHILGRTFYWSYLAPTVLRLAPKKESEIKLEEGATATSLLLLQ